MEIHIASMFILCSGFRCTLCDIASFYYNCSDCIKFSKAFDPKVDSSFYKYCACDFAFNMSTKLLNNMNTLPFISYNNLSLFYCCLMTQFYNRRFLFSHLEMFVKHVSGMLYKIM